MANWNLMKSELDHSMPWERCTAHCKSIEMYSKDDFTLFAFTWNTMNWFLNEKFHFVLCTFSIHQWIRSKCTLLLNSNDSLAAVTLSSRELAFIEYTNTRPKTVHAYREIVHLFAGFDWTHKDFLLHKMRP